jgi:hypothetical protein
MANDLRRLWGREESGWAEYRSAPAFATEPPFSDRRSGREADSRRTNRNPLPPEGGLARAGVTTRKCYFCVDR